MAEKQALPIWRYRSRIADTVAAHQVTIIVGPPGCGKTTVVPQILLPRYGEHGLIAVTQPRRLAARTVATYVAQQLEERVIGRLVGYRVRFDHEVSADTRLVFMTDGVLVTEFLKDRTLPQYAAVVLDEVHERSVDTDLCLAFAKLMLQARHDVRLVLMSATMQTADFAAYFDRPPIVEIPSQAYPVTVRYASDTRRDDVAGTVVRELQQLCAEQAPSRTNGILVFLPGEGEIYNVRRQLREAPIANTVVWPLHGTLRPEEQDKVFDKMPKGIRKIVLATNIAETSVTVPGIGVVLDAGLMREQVHDPASGIDCLQTTVSYQANSIQRAGRAGRLGPGECVRLFSEKTFNKQVAWPVPVICRSSLARVYLALCAAGVADPTRFPWLAPPRVEAWHEAREVLMMLGAIDAENRLTLFGWRMARLSIEPRLAKVLLVAHEAGCLDTALTICAMLTERSILYEPYNPELRAAARAKHQLFWTEGSDCLAAHAAYRAWERAGRSDAWCDEHWLRAGVLEEIARVRESLASLLLGKQETPHQTDTFDRAALDHALISGFGDQLWRRADRYHYRHGTGARCVLDGASAAYNDPPEWMICVTVKERGRPVAYGVHPVNPADVAAVLSGSVTRVRLPRVWHHAARDAVVAAVLVPDTNTGTVEFDVVRVPDAEASCWLAKALAEGRLITDDTVANEAVRRELGELRERLGAARVPDISQVSLRAFLEERLGGITSLQAARRCCLRLTPAELRQRWHCDITQLRRVRHRDFPDELGLGGRSVRVRYEQGVPTIQLDSEAVANLPYDAVTLPGGDLVRIEMRLPDQGALVPQSMTSTSVAELQRWLATASQQSEAVADLQRRCDNLRERLAEVKKSQRWPTAETTATVELLKEAERLIYSWKPDVAASESLIGELERKLDKMLKPA